MKATDRRLVWDLPLRLFHWWFAASIIACWGSAKLGFSYMQWHMWLGYWVMGLLLFRLIWGFIGTRHARFAGFIKGPSKVLSYGRGLIGKGPAIHSVGHNPLGGLMVLLMLLLVGLQVYTGLFSSDDIAWSGPYNGAVSSTMAQRLTGLHHLNFNLIWAAMGLHVAAILYYTFVKRERLVPAMVTGRKADALVPADQAIDNSALWRAAIAIAVSAGAVYWILAAAPAAPPASSSFM